MKLRSLAFECLMNYEDLAGACNIELPTPHMQLHPHGWMLEAWESDGASEDAAIPHPVLHPDGRNVPLPVKLVPRGHALVNPQSKQFSRCFKCQPAEFTCVICKEVIGNL